MPEKAALAVLELRLEDEAGNILHRNFTTFRVADGQAPRQETVTQSGQQNVLVRFDPSRFHAAQWSLKQWNVLEGLKVNGAGHGYFEYRVAWPAGLDVATVQGASLRVRGFGQTAFWQGPGGGCASRRRFHARQRHARSEP